MKRNVLVALTLALIVLAAGAVMVAQQSKDDPTLHPGIASIGRILIVNKGPKETIPVTIDTGSDLMRVQVAGTTPVQIAGTPNVQSRTMRQMWEYRQLVLPAGQDPTASLNAAGLDGWEATGIALASTDATRIILKRPTDR
jgi:hypothetical protein